METTAQGVGGEFYDRWYAAVEGRSNYVPIFLSWLIDDEYTLKFRDEEESQKLKNSVDDIEEGLLKSGASWEHLNWRRRIGLPDKCGGDVDVFRQEYPDTPESAYITSGSPVFDVKKCNANLISSNNFKPQTGNLEWVGKEVVFRSNERGYIKLYQEIETKDNEHHKYCAGVDIAEGLAQGDYSVCSVMDRKTEKVCMVWHSHIDTDLFSEELYKIYIFLKKRVVFEIESNGGYGVIKKLYHLGKA